MSTDKKSKSKKEEHRFSHQGLIEVKTIDEDLIVKGYIATTHFDGQDVILKETLDKWAVEINKGIPVTNKVSLHHDRQPQVVGVGLKGSARVEQLRDGEYGLYVDSKVNKALENYKEIEYEISNDMIDSFSIEYMAKTDCDYTDYGARILDIDTELRGWTLASRPMNSHAVMIKELINSDDSKQCKETISQEEVNTEENEMVDENKEKQPVEEPKPVVGETMSEEDKELLRQAKIQRKENEMKENFIKMLESKELQSKIQELSPQKKPLQNKEEEPEPEQEKPEEKERRERNIEFKNIIQNKELASEEKFRRVGLLAEKEGLVWVEGTDGIGFKKSTEKQPGMQFKEFQCNGSKMEYKSLGITTNQNSDTDYLLSAGELRDMFDPVIYDVLNQSTTTWGLLRKEDYSMKGNNQVQFVIRNAANTTAAFYTDNSVTTSQSGLLKCQTKFKKVDVGVKVDGDMIAAARGGPIGDVFGAHVGFATEDMLTVVNSALFAENGAETDAECIGFEYITDSAGNTTLYNLTRANVTGLAPSSASDTYINGSSARISVDNMRKAIEQAVTEGADINNLVFITHPTQERLFKGIYDDTQRLMPTSARFGFVGRPEFDAVPVFADKDCNTDDWWLVDLASHKIAVWVPPTLEMLGKRSDSEEGFVKMYFATYNTNPNRMVQIYGNATS